MRIFRRFALSTNVVAPFMLLASSAHAEPNRVTFPENFDEMVFYGDYRRGSGGEMAYALPETIEIAKRGEDLPYGTHLVLEILADNQVTSYFVMEKGEGFGLDYSEEIRTSDWQFQQFDTNRQVMASSTPGQCMSCHSNRAETDFRFTTDRMLAYMP